MIFRVYKEKDIYNIPDDTMSLILRCYIDFDKINIKLSEKIVFIDFDYNHLTSLPVLSKKLLYLFCANNKLTYLPKLPETLQSLSCINNQLVILPNLPITMQILRYNNDNLCYPDSWEKIIRFQELASKIKHDKSFKFFKNKVLRRIYRRRLVIISPLWRENSIIYNDILINYFNF